MFVDRQPALCRESRPATLSPTHGIWGCGCYRTVTHNTPSPCVLSLFLHYRVVAVPRCVPGRCYSGPGLLCALRSIAARSNRTLASMQLPELEYNLPTDGYDAQPGAATGGAAPGAPVGGVGGGAVSIPAPSLACMLFTAKYVHHLSPYLRQAEDRQVH
jgi:hypothetical protein